MAAGGFAVLHLPWWFYRVLGAMFVATGAVLLWFLLATAFVGGYNEAGANGFGLLALGLLILNNPRSRRDGGL